MIWVVFFVGAAIVAVAVIGVWVIGDNDRKDANTVNTAVTGRAQEALQRLGADGQSPDWDSAGLSARFSGVTEILHELPPLARIHRRSSAPALLTVIAGLVIVGAGALYAVDRVESRRERNDCLAAFQPGAGEAATTTAAPTSPTVAADPPPDDGASAGGEGADTATTTATATSTATATTVPDAPRELAPSSPAHDLLLLCLGERPTSTVPGG